MNNKEIITALKNKVLSGGNITDEEAYQLTDMLPESSDDLREAAAEITSAFAGPVFDSCSIVNARSGLCSENCKWCAQSKHHSTNCETYDLIDHDECLEAARYAFFTGATSW